MMVNAADVLKELKEVHTVLLKFSEHMNEDNNDVRYVVRSEVYDAVKDALKSPVKYDEWESERRARPRLTIARDFTRGTFTRGTEGKKQPEEIEQLKATIDRLKSKISDNQIMACKVILERLGQEKLTLEEAKQYKDIPIYFVSGTESDEQLKQLQQLGQAINNKIFVLEKKPMLEEALSKRKGFLEKLYGLDYTQDTIPSRPKGIDSKAFPAEMREEGVLRQISGLDVRIDLVIFDLQKKKQAREDGLAEEGRVFLEKYKAYKAFSKKLKETSPFDVEEVLENRPALLLEDSKFYEPEGEQAQKIKRKLGKAEEKINREVNRLRGEADKLRGEKTFKTLSDRFSQLKTYFDRLKSIESGLKREKKLPSRPEKLDLEYLRNQWGSKLERGKKKPPELEALQKRLQTYLEKEIDKLEQLEKNIDEKTVQLTGSNQLVEHGDGTFQTFHWVQAEQARVYREWMHVQEERAKRIEELKQFESGCLFFFQGLNSEGLNLEKEIEKRPKKPDFHEGAEGEELELQVKIDNLENDIDKKIAQLPREKKLNDFINMLKERIDLLKELVKKANCDADTELTQLNQAIEDLKVERKQSLINPTDAPSEADNFKAFEDACEVAFWDSLERINKEAYLRPEAEAAKVHEHTSDFWQWLLATFANFFGLGSSKAPTPTSQVSQDVGTEVSSQFKEKFAQTITITKEREGGREQDEAEDKENIKPNNEQDSGPNAPEL